MVSGTASADVVGMARRLRFVDDIAVFDMAQQLSISIAALIRDLAAGGVDVNGYKDALVLELSHLETRADMITFLARLSPVAEELTTKWVKLKEQP